jgi:hypothetical protein
MSDLLNSASLVMIPSGYKEYTVFSAIPTDGSGDLSFTRASNGTRINSAGLVEVCPWNLAQYSEQFTNAIWGPKNGTFTDNFAVAPNGTTTAAKWQATDSDPYIYQSFNGTNQLYTATCYVKATGTAIGKNSSIRMGGDVAIFALTGDWQRLTITGNINGSTNVGVEAPESATSGEIVYIWGFQINIGSTAKPYFPTTDRLNVPRLTYQNGGGGCPSLLLEKQSTNLALYSEDFSSGWTQANITVTANNTTSPDGTQNADKIQASGSGSVSHSVRQFISTTSGSVYALSLYAKKGTTDWIMIRHDNGGTLNYFNLNTGTKGTADASATITSVGNGWYRIVVYHTGTGSNGPEIYIATSDGGNEFTASGQNIYIWGAQYEASSYPTSYIPTTSASATRVADACYKTGISSLIGQTEGVLFWDIEVETLSASGNENILNVDSGSFGNTMYLIKTATGGVVAEIYVSNVAQCLFSYSLPSVGRYKMALAYKANDFALYVNGVSRGTDSSGSVPTCSRLQLGNGVLGPSDGKTNQAVLFKTRLTNAELASLTTI